jgi:hypothetical protein
MGDKDSEKRLAKLEKKTKELDVRLTKFEKKAKKVKRSRAEVKTDVGSGAEAAAGTEGSGPSGTEGGEAPAGRHVGDEAWAAVTPGVQTQTGS